MGSDPQYSDAQQQEQMRQYVEQLRAADPAEIVAQAFTMLATGAEVKIGNPDARVLIDALGGMISAVEGRVPEQLVSGMRNGLVQLQQAQVQAEGQSSKAAEQGPDRSAAAPGDAEAPSAGAQQAQSGFSAAGGQAQDGGDRMTDRLWIPGRGQPPPTG